MEIFKVKNYKHFANTLRNATNCEININLMGEDHVHYQLNKDGISLGILCIDRGVASFAPFATHQNVSDDQYINVQYMPMIDDLIQVLRVFNKLFVVDTEEMDVRWLENI